MPTLASPTSDANVSTGDMFKRRELPPEGVAQQLLFGGGAGGFCNSYKYKDEFGNVQVSRIDAIPDTWINWSSQQAEIELLDTSLGGLGHGLCFAWFKPNQFINAELQRSDGVVLRKKVATDPEGFAVWPWVGLPSDPLGEYSITGVQDELSASATFTLREPSKQLMETYPKSGPLGLTFQVGFYNFQPNETLQLYLYKEEGDVRIYQTALLPAQMDQQGRAIYRLESQPDDPPGRYFLMTFGQERPEIPQLVTEFYLGSGEPLDHESIASASSTLPAEDIAGIGLVSYDPVKVLDFNLSTAWVEGVPGPGIGERITLEFSQPFVLTAFEVDVGFDRDESVFFANNRLKSATLVFADGSTQSALFSDQRRMQSFPIANITTSSFTIVIDQVYPGSQFDDTALADVIVYGYPVP